MILVEALDTYTTKNIEDGELKRKPKKGEQFKVSKERLNVLLGNNKHNVAFVKIVDEQPKKEKATIPKKNVTKRKK